jgi:hypothetical protein
MGSPENHLFQAVLARAFEDATARVPATKTSGGTRQDEQAQARTWLLKGGADMQTVCLLADVPPETVQKAAETLAHMHWRWRRVGVPVSQKHAMLPAWPCQAHAEDSHTSAAHYGGATARPAAQPRRRSGNGTATTPRSCHHTVAANRHALEP